MPTRHELIPEELARKLQYAANRYRENMVTLARAAEEAGASVREMMDYLRQQKVPMQYDAEDFERDLKGIYERSPSLRRRRPITPNRPN